MPPPVKVRRKKKVGRPAFKRKDIPQIFFTYYDAYKYGFWNKQDLAYFVGVSRPTLDRYFKTIEARVSMCESITSLEYSIVSMASFKEHLARKCLDPHEFILRLDPKNYYMMNIIDYLVGNTDRHMGNWGVLVDNATNRPRRLHELMDFNQSFNAYDTIDGAN